MKHFLPIVLQAVGLTLYRVILAATVVAYISNITEVPSYGIGLVTVGALLWTAGEMMQRTRAWVEYESWMAWLRISNLSQ